MSVLFNHACRYELFDRNPIYLVRQSAKRRRAPTVLMPAEIKALVDNLGIRERTLVLLAVSTGLRQSELFGLKWSDIDFDQATMNVTRFIVYGVVGPCKTEPSQKPVPVHPLLADALSEWRRLCTYTEPDDWFLLAGATGDGGRTGDRPFYESMFDRLRNGSESRNVSAGTRFVTRIRRC
jgi:integrase